jgi:hypothetical protein
MICFIMHIEIETRQRHFVITILFIDTILIIVKMNLDSLGWDCSWIHHRHDSVHETTLVGTRTIGLFVSTRRV